ncbi:MAG TPA: sigma-70 family RNA polymerase sigma factor [Candidatus Sulfotelmatobacter sp.]|nr:sigma-70 family RNA polymerase sigma factor [Candidatus Sulfotelmatobacter sp.]
MHFSEDFEKIYLKYSDKIFRYLYLNTSDPYLSEDITSEVFLRIWKKWKTIKPDFMQALLYKTAKNILIDYYRKNKNNKKVSLEETVERGIEPSYDEDLIEKINKDDNIKKINSAINLLPQNLKEVLVLRFINDLSAKEAAEILNTTEVNIRVLQYRGLKKLKEELLNE